MAPQTNRALRDSHGSPPGEKGIERSERSLRLAHEQAFYALRRGREIFPQAVSHGRKVRARPAGCAGRLPAANLALAAELERTLRRPPEGWDVKLAEFPAGPGRYVYAQGIGSRDANDCLPSAGAGRRISEFESLDLHMAQGHG